jgi:hypothetical protein
MQALVAVGSVSLDQLIRRGWIGLRIPLIYVGGIAIFYVLTRQHPGNFIAFVHTSAQVSAAYVDAVGLPGPFIDALVYLIVAALALAMIADFHWRAQQSAGVLPVLALGALLLLLYKHSFVRQDFAHATIGPLVLFGLCVLYLPVVWSHATGTMRKTTCIVVVSLAAIVGSSSLTGYNSQTLPGLFAGTIWRAMTALGALANQIAEPSRLHREWEKGRAQLRQDNFVPVEQITGPVDVYPHRVDVLYAYGLRYDPRPSILSIVATSPALAEANAGNLRRPEAPQSILFDVETVDEDFPAMLDGTSWPDLLTRYDLIDTRGSFLLLRRAATPRSYQFTPLPALSGQFDKPLALPGINPLWAKIQLTPRFTGKAISALYRPPIVVITARTRNGIENTYRLLPALAGHGFLLSPLIKSRADFAMLSTPSWQRELQPESVESITIKIGEGSADTYFEPNYAVELSRFDFPRRDLPASKGR